MKFVVILKKMLKVQNLRTVPQRFTMTNKLLEGEAFCVLKQELYESGNKTKDDY